jgi:hypothetical protein
VETAFGAGLALCTGRENFTVFGSDEKAVVEAETGVRRRYASARAQAAAPSGKLATSCVGNAENGAAQPVLRPIRKGQQAGCKGRRWPRSSVGGFLAIVAKEQDVSLVCGGTRTSAPNAGRVAIANDLASMSQAFRDRGGLPWSFGREPLSTYCRGESSS